MKLELGMNQVSASHTVYWTGKVVIGGAYQPPAKDHGASADAIQRALIANVSGAPAVKPVAKPVAWKLAAEAAVRRLIDFIEVYAEYRQSHGRLYSARIAYGIAFQGRPF